MALPPGRVSPRADRLFFSSPGCIVCPAHKTAFDLATGAVVGPWCPGMPDLPFVGKVNNDVKPLPVYTVRVEGDAVAVSV